MVSNIYTCFCSEVVPVVFDGEDKTKDKASNEETPAEPKKGPPKVVVDLTLSDESDDEAVPATNGPVKPDSAGTQYT